ncbi:uncharacterized protein FFB20_04108 [Fusarium fujikuroi]|nr:uncharacterized protein FFB20_04108 [Fusarium fujikuroi]SCN88655.1 uncharacterized protein FFC1_05526 [Fusarium fujikuroi]SCN93200.1 uncharacterized protein FFE2_07619 [Fusarium fujikuroi]SCV52210.1 uncharacterized protein FFB14_12471 [Fusarium fujikuroi]
MTAVPEGRKNSKYWVTLDAVPASRNSNVSPSGIFKAVLCSVTW